MTGTLPTDFGYTGQRNEEFGLHDYHARYYSSRLGRFVSPDSIVPGVGGQAHNRYMYTAGNPIRHRDPTGHVPGGPLLDHRGGGVGDSCVDNPFAAGCQGKYHDAKSPMEIVNRYPYDEQTGLHEAQIWLEGHPDYDLFADSSAWGVNRGELVPRNSYLHQMYMLWRAARGEQDLLQAQSEAQQAAWLVDRKHILLSQDFSQEADTWGAAVEVVTWGAIQTGQTAAAMAITWVFGRHKSMLQWQNRMTNRGWTVEQISQLPPPEAVA